MYYSPTQAIKHYVVSKPTLYKDMSDGNLSFKIDDKKRRKINVAELGRLYEPRETRASEASSGNVKQGSQKTENSVNGLTMDERTELAVLRAKVESLSEERVRERKQLEEQIEMLRENLTVAMDSQKNLTLMIENQNRVMDQLREENAPGNKKRRGFLGLFSK